MKQISFIISFLLVTFLLIGQQPISVGEGSYSSSVPFSVYEEGGYFGKTYRELSEGWPWYIHSEKQSEPIPTNSWWTAAIFDRYTGRLEAYPQRVEGLSSGIRVSAYTDFRMTDDRGLSAFADNWIEIGGEVAKDESSTSIVFADFESDSYPSGWVINGTAPYSGPVSLSQIEQAPEPSGFLGSRFINTFKGDGPQVSFTSPSFVIEKKYIHLLVGGGNNIDLTYVDLFINGNRIVAATGENSGFLSWKRFDVSSYKGQTAEIRIVDASSGGWGFIMCDNIVFSDEQEVNSSFSNNFWPQDAKVLDWSGLSVTFRLEDNNGNYMDGTAVHGVPYTYIDFNGIAPVITGSSNASAYYNGSGAIINSFPVTTNSLIVDIEGSLFGVHAPYGSVFNKNSSGDLTIQFPSGKSYVVLSWIPAHSLISTYDNYARNKILDSRFEWDYQVSQGKIITTFVFDTKNYETGTTGGATIFAMLPHHYREATAPSALSGGIYPSLRGELRSTVGTRIDLDYVFGGMPPFLPAPLNINATQADNIEALITQKVADSNNFWNGNTYAKGFGEESNVMLMAKEMNHPGYGTIRDNIKRELKDWLTFDSSEADAGSYFFARYPEFGALVGFPTGYGSQAFNDLHFHYGYFIMGATRLMLVDDEFKNEYGDMVKMIAKSYANWVRGEKKSEGGQPFLRTFDPYMGNSWAGGIGSSYDGNNQESTSEATHSWFAIYLLGVALDDDEIMSLGATGFMLEGLATANYWFNLNGDLPPAYTYNYVGIMRPNNIAMATYFHGDPAWAFGIQFVPSDFLYTFYWGKDEVKAKDVFDEMLNDRIIFGESTTTDYYSNLAQMGDYLGGYYVNYINLFNPVLAADLLDQLYTNEGEEWRRSINTLTNYYNIHSTITYGRPAEGYHTSIPTGTVYKKPDSEELIYLIYNPKDITQTVTVYEGNNVLTTIEVGPGQYYNNQLSNQTPVANGGGNKTIQSPANSVVLDGSLSYDSDGAIVGYLWEQISGKPCVIESPNNASTLVKELSYGEYLYRLTVTDNEGSANTEQIKVTVLPSEVEINIALNKPATASSIQEPWKISDVNDGNINTRWGSEMGVDPQWVMIDLERPYKIYGVKLFWEGAFASKYEIQLSDNSDFSQYQVLYTENNGNGNEDEITLSGEYEGRYIRMYGIERGTPYGYSLFEFKVFGISLTTDIKYDKVEYAIYPSPAKDWINIKVNNYAKAELYSLNGHLLSSQNINGEAKMDLRNIENGLYILKITANEEIILNKIIINK